ncbi:ABC transporter ATP-binding protein [Fictibacillus sp. BK138]|uniref:ABC transporter ATP-binding protein n=1 Tax=Fictibacillus sp. BK138 TaxID=2512121 RepID=UPI00102A86BC|nr:ABC transporter ATP-binding protein [Fictibacillus sp. BK138]RZT21657.1 putative ABC transport system ATP-binding protein [Fictibacillus sp. BK138]
MMEHKLILDKVSKTFVDGEKRVSVIEDMTLKVNEGEFVAVVGPSGSGKSTFLSLAGALLAPTSGRTFVGGHELSQLSESGLNRIRLEKLGFVFQSSNLIPYLTVIDQLILVSELSGKEREDAKSKAKKMIKRLGLSHRINHYPEQLSGGERQRVAIARAWMNDPELILADEPTASLDSERGKEVVQMLADEVKLRGKAAVMVTHDQRMLDLCDRILYMEDGRFVKEKNQMNEAH